MAFRRAALEAIGSFDAALGTGAATRAGEDTDLVFRASWAGFRGAYLPHLLVRHHHGPRTATEALATVTGYDIGRGAFYAKYLGRPDTRLFMLRKWWWHLHLRSAAGRRRFLNDLRGAWIFLRCAPAVRAADRSAAPDGTRARQPALP